MRMYYVGGMPISDELYHHGIKGQKWGVRRYQNEDGSLTSAGQERYYGSNKSRKNIQRDLNRADQEAAYAKGDFSKHTLAEQRLRNKAQKLVNRNTGTDGVARLNARQTAKLSKMAKKAMGHIDAAEAAQKRYKEIANDVNKLLGEAAKQGYSVLATPKYRETMRSGEQIVNVLLYGGIGAGIKQIHDYGVEGSYMEGHKYKVRG